MKKLTALLFALSLTACVQGQTPAQNTQTVIADVTAAYNALNSSFEALLAAQPTLIAPDDVTLVRADLQTGAALLAQLQANATNEQVWLQVEDDLNAALAVLSKVPLPPPYNLVVVAAMVIAPELETYINQQFGLVQTAAKARATYRHADSHMSLDEARHVVRSH